MRMQAWNPLSEPHNLQATMAIVTPKENHNISIPGPIEIADEVLCQCSSLDVPCFARLHHRRWGLHSDDGVRNLSLHSFVPTLFNAFFLFQASPLYERCAAFYYQCQRYSWMGSSVFFFLNNKLIEYKTIILYRYLPT